MLGVPETENQCELSCAIPTRKAVRKTHPETYVNFRPETRVDFVRGGAGIVTLAVVLSRGVKIHTGFHTGF